MSSASHFHHDERFDERVHKSRPAARPESAPLPQHRVTAAIRRDVIAGRGCSFDGLSNV